MLAAVLCIAGGVAFWYARNRQTSTQSDPNVSSARAPADRPREQNPAPSLPAVQLGPTIAEMLIEINKKLSPRTFPFINAHRAKNLRAALESRERPVPETDRLQVAVTYAIELMNAGHTEEALGVYRSIVEGVKKSSPDSWKKMAAQALLFEAVGYLRLGEQQNCCDANNSNSCLVPISGAGIHTKQSGSREAIKRLNEMLELNPNDLSARWLLNIAYMTVGEYPDKVPAQWLIPLEKYGGDYPLKKFVNEAPKLKLDMTGWAGSVVMEDFEENGLLGLLISSWRFDVPLRYFRNNGDGTFTDATQMLGLPGELGGLNMIVTDYNNDGRPDIVVLRGGWFGENGFYPFSLLRNDGNAHFTNVTREAGLLTLGPTQTAVAFDYNGDGFLDLFVGYEASEAAKVTCKLFRNNGDGTFSDVSAECGLGISRFVKAAISADFTHNGRPGLYLSCLNAPNMLLRNDGPAGADASPRAPWKFTDVSAQAGVSAQRSSFSCFFFDYDNDGWADIYVNGYTSRYGGEGNLVEVAKDYLGMESAGQKAKLYRNNHDGTFSDISARARVHKFTLGMGVNFGDLDNDGWLDFYVGTGDPEYSTLVPNRMFRNHDGKFFDEVTTTADVGHLQKGHGIAFGSLRNNGQQDVFLVAGGAFEGDTAHDCLFVNPGHDNNWVVLKLTGVKANRIALGAQICVTVQTPEGERRIHRTVSTGGSFGCNPLRQEIGLGNATAITSVEILWPGSGTRQRIRNLSLKRFYKIQEGAAEAEAWNVPAFNYPSK